MGNCLGCTQKKQQGDGDNEMKLQKLQSKNQSSVQQPFQNIYHQQNNNGRQVPVPIGKSKREQNKNLTKLQKFFISEYQTLHITDFRAMYKIYSNSEQKLLQLPSEQQPNENHLLQNTNLIVLDKRIGFTLDEYYSILNEKNVLKLGQAQYSVLQDKHDIKVVKVQYEDRCSKNLQQTIAENSQDTKDLQKLYKSIILNLLQFLEQNKDKKVKFNFNPEQIIVFNDDIIENIDMQPQILFEMDNQTLDQNECLRVRWNITIDKKFEDQIGQKACEASNKLSLSMLAYWLEDDGYVRGSLRDKYLDIMINQDARQEYLKSLDSDCRLHKTIIKNINKNYTELINEIKAVNISIDRKISISRILTQTELKRSQVVFIDWLLDQYQKLEEKDQRLVKQKLRQLFRKSSQDQGPQGNQEILEELIDFIPELGNAKFTSASETLVEKMKTDHIRIAFNKIQRKVLILQILSTFENHSKVKKIIQELSVQQK